MAFARTSGKHRGPSRMTRRSASIAGAATLATTGVIGTLAAPAFASDGDGREQNGDPGTLSAEDTGTLQILAAEQPGTLQPLSASDSLSGQVADQAHAQKQQAVARAQAEAEAKREAEARAEAEREARERAARDAERKRLLNTWTAPVEGSGVTTSYRANSALWSSGTHTGIDFHASTGTKIVSVGAGTVVEAGWGGAYGYNVVIEMRDGSYTQYAHLSSLSVTAGQTVMPGQQIGRAGSTGNSTGAHLHFEVRTGAEYGSDVDPVAYLRGKGVRV
ncbi:M23 family metallopeptidase [Streptomyces sp. NPDC094448]|uniref:M23 family metallopeptidase n=1 Tax=Streptomyces sp. NPDC094448 TaxID=3366063 RepID=UPI003803A4AE